MEGTQKRFRVFLDTSVILSGLNSPLGASGVIISLFKLGKIEVVVSVEVLAEAARVVRDKLPLLQIPLADFLSYRPAVTKLLTLLELRAAYKLIQSEDTPILGGAIKARADVLVTLDKRFQKLASGPAPFDVLTPGELLHLLKDR